MAKCSAFHENPHNNGWDRCWATKETETCSCGGDEAKCDFYPEKRKKAAVPKFGEWISVKDRLPDVCFETNTYKETDDVFAIDDVGDKCVGRFAISKYDGSYTFYGYTADAEERDPLIVTHWLDCMPEPPKEG